MAFMLPPFSQRLSLTGLSTTRAVLKIYEKYSFTNTVLFKFHFQSFTVQRQSVAP